jgi:hypothetical protein
MSVIKPPVKSAPAVKQAAGPCPWIFTDSAGNKHDTRRMLAVDNKGRAHPIADKRGRGERGAKSWAQVNRILARGGSLILDLPGCGKVKLEHSGLDKDTKVGTYHYGATPFKVRNGSGEWVDATPAQRKIYADAFLLETLSHVKADATENRAHAEAVIDTVVSRMFEGGAGLPRPVRADSRAARTILGMELRRSRTLDGSGDRKAVVGYLGQRAAAQPSGRSLSDGVLLLADPATRNAVRPQYKEDSFLMVELAARGMLSDAEIAQVSSPSSSMEQRGLVKLHGDKVADVSRTREQLKSAADSEAVRYDMRAALVAGDKEYWALPMLPELLGLVASQEPADRRRADTLLYDAEVLRPGTLLWAATQQDSPELARAALGLLPSRSDLEYVEAFLAGGPGRTWSADTLTPSRQATIAAARELQELHESLSPTGVPGLDRISGMNRLLAERPALRSNPVFMQSLLFEAEATERDLWAARHEEAHAAGTGYYEGIEFSPEPSRLSDRAEGLLLCRRARDAAIDALAPEVDPLPGWLTSGSGAYAAALRAYPEVRSVSCPPETFGRFAADVTRVEGIVVAVADMPDPLRELEARYASERGLDDSEDFWEELEDYWSVDGAGPYNIRVFAERVAHPEKHSEYDFDLYEDAWPEERRWREDLSQALTDLLGETEDFKESVGRAAGEMAALRLGMTRGRAYADLDVLDLPSLQERRAELSSDVGFFRSSDAADSQRDVAGSFSGVRDMLVADPLIAAPESADAKETILAFARHAVLSEAAEAAKEDLDAYVGELDRIIAERELDDLKRHAGLTGADR